MIKLRKARIKKGYSLRDVCMVTGINYAAIYNYEHEKQIPSVMTAMTLCNAYGVSVYDIEEWNDDRHFKKRKNIHRPTKGDCDV